MMRDLVGWWLNHSSEKYAREIESFPQGLGQAKVNNI